MKAKLLSTMVLPALFAACTAEEFTETQNPGIAGRALLDPNFTITVNNGADTRFSWNEAEFGWNEFTAEDKFSAALVDNGTDVVDQIFTNYIFKTENGTDYKTNSQMVEGTYFYYSYPGFESVSSRDLVKFDLTKQTATNLAKPDSIVNANQLFIAPLYTLEAETANDKLPLEFVSYWSTAALSLKNNTNAAFKIVRILFETKNADPAKQFAVKGEISPAELADQGLEYVYTDGSYVLTGKDVVYDDIRTADIAKNVINQPALVVDCNSYNVEKGAEVKAYLQVPASVYTTSDLQVKVVVEVPGSNNTTALKEVIIPVASNETAQNGTKQTAFLRGKTTSLFGVEASAPVVHPITDIDLISAGNATGKYASSYEDMYEYLSAATIATTDVEIYNLGSLQLDDQLMALIEAVSKTATGLNVVFQNAIEITTENYNGASANHVTFKAGAALVKGTVTFGSDTDFETSTLTVSEGANAIVGTANVDAITNNGTVTLNVNPTSAMTVTNGEKANMVVNAAVTAGASKLVFGTMPKTLTVNKDKSLAVTDVEIAYGQTWTNNGTISGTLTNKGTIVNNATGTMSAVVTNEGELDGTTEKLAVINNYGKITGAAKLKEYSQVNMENNLASITIDGANSDNGSVDNTIGGFVSGTFTAAQAKVYAEYSGNKTGELGKVSGCNTVVLKNGTWTDPTVYSGVTNVEMTDVDLATSETGNFEGLKTKTIKMIGGSVAKAIEFGGSSCSVTVNNVTFNGDFTVATSTTAIDVNGCIFNKEFTSSTSEVQTLSLTGVTFNGKFTASNVTSLTIAAPAKNSGFGKRTSFNGVVTTGTLTNLTVSAGAELFVGLGVQLGNAGTTVITTAAKSAVYNYGTVNGKTGDSSIADGTWNGTPASLT